MALTARIATLAALAALASGCASISDHRGYVVDAPLVNAIQPGLDNKESVEGTLGRPSFTSQFGDERWYYVSSTTRQRPFTTPKIRVHGVLAIHFDEAGNVTEAELSGLERVAYLDPDGGSTPTLGKERGFLEDLFGNIGQVGSFGGGGSGPGPNGS
jgi:outer membrane protein assembly factor BamE (lipoprotein component of BamABCDE complex)